MKLILLQEAQNEMEEAANWYENQVPRLSDDFLLALHKAYLSILERPEAFPREILLKVNRTLRRYVLQTFPYIIIYQYNNNEIAVIAISHSSRKPDYWRERVH